MERKHLIPTQQITAEVVKRLPKHNSWIARGDTLVVGYDVTHPGKPSRDEIVNKMPPQRPSVVGVVEEELGAIKEACEEFGRLNGEESWMPLFTVIIATKRHNARFFVQNGRIIENPKPTTVVDTDVVRNDITEFYMQSHRPLQGTAKATSYQVIVDENNMSSDEIQSLMLALTFHHQISDAPVSIPEPVYQADEWAKRGKDIWKAYTDRHNAILMKERGEYADYPIDFEAMTKRLAFWNTKLENRRVNA
ncbi:piwi domain protein [Ancylostoma duodenale]|uniref:Piwi domain protein n=1 Tax=Ancylostoma duodenale TaxID=51022 RepID=A0A0C2HCW5_9BILA|nr:piwi domain protein [Ancylostoma duodenale]